jgi:uncharacterized protein
MKVDDIRNRIKKVIEDIDSSAEVYLFGSRARGDHRTSSDWDILILVDNPKITNEIEDKFRDGLYEIELGTGQLISIFIYTKNDWKGVLKHTPLFDNVIREGVRL